MIPTLRDKTIFNKFFHENIGRNWLCTDLCSLEDFVEFVKKYKRVICKPLNGGQGQGIFIYEYSNDKDAKQTFDSIPGFLVEELIVQHSVLSSINPTSVNTCRIVTFTYNGVAHIIACSLRTGVKGAVVDNLHSNTSQCWSIDIDSGIVFTPSCGYDYNHWLKHIGSGVQVIGMKIPNWEVAKSIVIKSAQKIPEIGYIGWDVAITEGGACLIEANHDPGHDLMQMIDQVGKYQYIKKIINQST